MPKKLIIGSETFDIPLQGDNPDYGEQLSDFFEAVAEALSTVQKPNDIADTTSAINNNQSVFSNIPGFSFNTAEVISIECQFRIERSTTIPATTVVESGTIEGNYNGTDWNISISGEGDSFVEFNITSGGQIQYRSSNMVGTGYIGSISFRAKVFNNV